MFSPYHQFTNCNRLRHCIKQLYDSTFVPDDINNYFCNYHDALEHKLKSAKFFLDRLETQLDTTIEAISADKTAFLFECNLCIDGFFYNGGSALDILAREVLACYNIMPATPIYYRDARAKIRVSYPMDPLLPRLADPPWKGEFSDYRNAATHEVLLSTTLHLEWVMSGSQQVQRIKLGLPDDPRVIPSARTFNKNSDAFHYCTTAFRRLLRHVNAIYGDIISRATANGRLPLP